MFPHEQEITILLKDVLGTLDGDGIRRIMTKKEELGKRLTQVLLDLSANHTDTPSHRNAREIMEQGNFYGIPEVERRFGVSIDRNQIDALSKIPFSNDTLTACRKDYVLVADIGLSIMGMYDKCPESFPPSCYEREDFEKCFGTVGWRLIRKDIYRRAFHRTWKDQLDFIPYTDEVPSTREVVYMLVLLENRGDSIPDGGRTCTPITATISDASSNWRPEKVPGRVTVSYSYKERRRRKVILIGTAPDHYGEGTHTVSIFSARKTNNE